MKKIWGGSLQGGKNDKRKNPSLLKPHIWQNLDHGFGLQPFDFCIV
jgi:hypothetical protein